LPVVRYNDLTTWYQREAVSMTGWHTTIGVQRPLWPSRNWWAALAAILALAGVLRFTGYNFGLPYIDHPDEPAFYIQAAFLNDSGTSPYEYMSKYAPAYIIMYRLLQIALNDPNLLPATQVAIMRAFSAVASLASVVVVALLAYQIAGSGSGLLAAALWAVLPTAITYSSYAMPEIYAVLNTVAALLSTVMALRTRRQRWVFVSIAFALLAFAFKYPTMPILPVVLLAPLVCRPSAGGQKLRQAVFISVAIAGPIVAWALFVHGGIDLLSSYKRWAGIEQDSSLLFELSLENTLANLRVATENQNILGLLAVAGLVLTLAWKDSRRHVNVWGLAVTISAALLLLIGISAFRLQLYRRLYPLAALLAVLWGVGMSVCVRLLDAFLPRVLRTLSASHLKLLRSALVVGLVTLMLAPAAATSWADAQERALRDSRVDLMEWADARLPPGPYLAGDSDYHKVFNRAWGGYAGARDFPLYRVVPIVVEPVEVWRAASVQYAIISFMAYQQLLEASIGRDYLDNMLLLKVFPPSPERRGPSMVVFRLVPIQHPLRVNFGDAIELVGYDLSSDHVRAGETVTVTHYWRSLTAPTAVYTVYNHLTPLDSRQIVAQEDGPPLEHSLTSTWDDPDEILIGRTFDITIGEDVPAGEYRLLTGLYVREEGRRLPVVGSAGADFAVLALVTVTR
jgi:4-amino-4-deoxy-L-arabinose transferase-like glycosyltransferase